MNMWRTIGLVGVVVTLCGAAQAQPGGPWGDKGREKGGAFGGGPGIQGLLRHPEAAKEMGVTDEQLVALRDGAYKMERDVIKLRADADLARLEVRRLLDQDQPDAEVLGKAIDEAGRIQTQIRKAKLLEQVRVRQILGKDTVAKLREEGRERREERWEKRHGQRMGGEGHAERPMGPRPDEDVPPEDVDD